MTIKNIENSLQNGCYVSFKTVVRDLTSTILQIQSLEFSGGSTGNPFPPPLFWEKEKEMTDGRKAGRASKKKPGPSH